MLENPLPLLNLLACAAGIWICVCRSVHMSASTTKPAIRMQYVGWSIVLFASGLSPLFGVTVNAMQIIFAAWFTLHMLIGLGAWRHGPPAYTQRPRVVELESDRFVERRFQGVK